MLQKAEEIKRDIEGSIQSLKDSVSGVKKFVNTAGNILNGACNGISSTLGMVGKGIKTGVNSILNAFGIGRRRKRSSGVCDRGIPKIPDIDLNVPHSQKLDQLVQWVKR